MKRWISRLFVDRKSRPSFRWVIFVWKVAGQEFQITRPIEQAKMLCTSMCRQIMCGISQKQAYRAGQGDLFSLRNPRQQKGSKPRAVHLRRLVCVGASAWRGHLQKGLHDQTKTFIQTDVRTDYVRRPPAAASDA